jgi:hypothetical protein
MFEKYYEHPHKYVRMRCALKSVFYNEQLSSSSFSKKKKKRKKRNHHRAWGFKITRIYSLIMKKKRKEIIIEHGASK